MDLGKYGAITIHCISSYSILSNFYQYNSRLIKGIGIRIGIGIGIGIAIGIGIGKVI